MKEKKGIIPVVSLVFAVTFLYYLMFYGNFGISRIGNATVFLFIPFVVYVSIFLNGFWGFFFGTAVGFMLDAVSAVSPCFNTVILMLFGVTAGLISRLYFNNNFLSAIIIGFFYDFLYFSVRFAIFTLPSGERELLYAFVQEVALSTVYTVILGIIPYLIVKKISQTFLTDVL